MTVKQPKQKISILKGLFPEDIGVSLVHISPEVLCDFMFDSLAHPAQSAIALSVPSVKECEILQRKVTFRMYPKADQIIALNRTATAHCKIYNTLLETSRLRYKAGLPAYTRTTVCEAVKAIRNAHGWIEQATTAQSAQVTGVRLVRAFDNFFARMAKGATPGYPRFKSYKKYPGWGYKAYGDGWSLVEQKSKTNPQGKTKHGYSAIKLTIGSSVTIPIHGASRFLGVPKVCEVLRKGDKWFLSVTVDVAKQSIERTSGSESMAFDWGLTTLLTTVTGDPFMGSIQEVENPRWLKRQLEQIARVQRKIAALESDAKKVSGKEHHFPVGHLLSKRLAAHILNSG